MSSAVKGRKSPLEVRQSEGQHGLWNEVDVKADFEVLEVRRPDAARSDEREQQGLSRALLETGRQIRIGLSEDRFEGEIEASPIGVVLEPDRRTGTS